jgi:hypothetical protein
LRLYETFVLKETLAMTLLDHIATFEREFPQGSWLVRKGSPDTTFVPSDQYLCTLTLYVRGVDVRRFQVVAPAPDIAFAGALEAARRHMTALVAETESEG